MITDIDHLRREFLRRLYGYDAETRANLVAIEQDEEITELKRVALEIQHFEMAFFLNHELRRRGLERPVDELVAAALNNRAMVFKRVDDMKGWHLVECVLRKPGVYKICVTRKHIGGRAEIINGFAAQALVTTAIEFGYLSKPNGYTLPT